MVGVGIAIGTGLGVPIGLAFDNMALGIAIGSAIGVAIGAAIEQSREARAAEAYGAGRRTRRALVGVGLVLLLGLVAGMVFLTLG
jgi:hypothetical protein